MNKEYYEVMLMIEENINDAHNPTFLLETLEEMVDLITLFIDQGYEVAIRSKGESDE